MNRRDVLRLALGAPFYAAACKTARAAVPDGELLDPGMALGHAMRDTPPPAPAAPGEPVERARVVIAGAGVAGLSCARRLKERGVDDVVLFDIADEANGTARGGRSGVSPYPWGAHYITAPMKENVDLVRFLDGLGLFEGKDAAGDPIPAEGVSCRAPEERIFFRGSFYPGLYLREGASDDDLAELARFERELRSLAGTIDENGRRAFAIPRAHASERFLYLDRISFQAWLDERRFTSWRLRWLCDYACRDDYGSTLSQVSAWAGLFYFASRRRSSTSEERGVMTWPEGNAFLAKKLAEQAQAKPRVNEAVVNVVPRDGAVDVIVRDRSGAARTVRAEHAVLACPRFIALRLVEPLRNERPMWAKAFETAPWVVANLHLRGRPKSRGAAQVAWDTVFVESESLGYVTSTWQRGADVGPTVLTWYMPLVDDDPKAARRRMLALTRAEWAEAALSDIAVAHPGFRPLVERVDVCRWGHAMVRPSPGLASSLQDAQRAVGCVHFAHTDLSGLALFEEAFFHGIRAADEVVLA